MVLEWWMLLTIGIFWIVSILSYGTSSFNQGSIVMLAKLQETGYIHIDDDGNITGLCNQDQENWRDLNQSDNKEEE